jgi:hypothetical protein
MTIPRVWSIDPFVGHYRGPVRALGYSREPPANRFQGFSGFVFLRSFGQVLPCEKAAPLQGAVLQKGAWP